MKIIEIPKWFQHLFKCVEWRIKTNKKEIFLSFDDGPNIETTDWILNELENLIKIKKEFKEKDESKTKKTKKKIIKKSTKIKKKIIKNKKKKEDDISKINKEENKNIKYTKEENTQVNELRKEEKTGWWS